jgi:hypothetical protein
VQAKTPDYGCPTEMAPQEMYTQLGEKKRGQVSDVYFTYFVINRFLQHLRANFKQMGAVRLWAFAIEPEIKY